MLDAERQNPICPLCGGGEHVKYFNERHYDLLCCQNCDLFFIDPYPLSTGEVHTRVVTYDYKEIKMVDPIRKYNAEVQFYQNYYPLIERELKNADTFLDVGCGSGRLLEIAKNFPLLHREGIELNSDRALFARQKGDCPIHQVPIEKFKSDVRYDVITMINVLSHIPGFDDLFTALRSLLSPNGRLIFKVSEMNHQVRKKDIFDWHIPDHLQFLGMSTLEYICRKYRFTIQYHQRIPIAKELFSRSRWLSPGRSQLRNVIKNIIVRVPFALPTLQQGYRLTRGDRFFSSFIVLSPLP